MGIHALNRQNPGGLKAVILDRDGVINAVTLVGGVPQPPRGLRDLQVLPGVPNAIKRLRNAGFLVFCLTNQPEISRGTVKEEDVAQISDYLTSDLGILEVFVCHHDDKDGCHCRKPKPGGINYFVEKYSLDQSQCFMVGDRWRDIDAGINAGCRTIFIENSYAEKKPSNQDFSVKSLDEGVKIILGEIA
jgi:D-glycero-D-manno-heptose 1,7-bisphosphate phosphatase